jgi:hypothetical protein
MVLAISLMAALKVQAPVRKFERIEMGMTLEEVNSILGTSPSSGSLYAFTPRRGPHSTVHYKVGIYRVTITFDGEGVWKKSISDSAAEALNDLGK